MNKNRKIKPKVRMYVEGKTEYNYFLDINNFKYKNIDNFKADNNIFNFLNSNGRNREIALSKLRKKESFVNNDFNPVIRKKGDIKIKNKKIILNSDFETVKNSNMCDFFDIIEKSAE